MQNGDPTWFGLFLVVREMWCRLLQTGNSSDLNPIENVWSIIKEHLQDRDALTAAKLKTEIQDIWDNIIPNM